jgi:transporter family protein
VREWIVPALGTFIFWGLWGFIPKLTTKYVNPMSAIVYEAIGGILIAVLALCLLRFHPDTHSGGIVLAVAAGVVGFLGAITYLIAVSKGQISLVVSFTALYPALSILLAVIVLNEPITLKQGLGILLALIAMLLVAT